MWTTNQFYILSIYFLAYVIVVLCLSPLFDVGAFASALQSYILFGDMESLKKFNESYEIIKYYMRKG